MHILHCEYGHTKKGELNQRKAAFSWMWRLTETCCSSKQRTRQRHLLLNTGWQTWHKDKTRGSSLHVDGVFIADGGSQEATLDYFPRFLILAAKANLRGDGWNLKAEKPYALLCALPLMQREMTLLGSLDRQIQQYGWRIFSKSV